MYTYIIHNIGFDNVYVYIYNSQLIAKKKKKKNTKKYQKI